MEGRAPHGSGERKAILTQNRETEQGPRQEDLGPHDREKLGCAVGPQSRGHRPCSVLEEPPISGSRRAGVREQDLWGPGAVVTESA